MNETYNKKQIGVLMMRGSTIDIYTSSNTSSVFSFQFSSEIYAEMEIKNVELATKQLIDFFAVNQIPPTEFVFIIQSPLFRKEFPIAPQEKLESTINVYLDYIPFDSVLSKRIKTETGVMIIAANGDLIQSIRKMFAATSSTIDCVTALEGLSIFPKGGLSILTQLSAETILKNIVLIKQESFSLTPQRSVEGFEVAEEVEEKEKSSLPLLLPVFVVLLALLGLVYYLSSKPSLPVASKKNIVNPSSSKLYPSTAATSIPNTYTPTIKLSTSKSLVDQINKIKLHLNSAGYTSIIEDIASDSPNSRSFVIYSSNVPSSVKTSIQSILKSVIPVHVQLIDDRFGTVGIYERQHFNT